MVEAGNMREHNERKLPVWAQVRLAEARGDMKDARGIAICLWTVLDLLRRRGLNPEVQDLFSRVDHCRPSWLTLPPEKEKP